MSCKGASFFLFGFIIFGAAMIYLILDFRVKEVEEVGYKNCLKISYIWEEQEYPQLICFNQGQNWKKLKNSFAFYRAYSALYVGFFAFYFLINMFFFYLGQKRIYSCNYYWLLFQDRQKTRPNCFLCLIQGLLMAIFLLFVVLVSFVLLMINVSCPKKKEIVEKQKQVGLGTNDQLNNRIVTLQ